MLMIPESESMAGSVLCLFSVSPVCPVYSKFVCVFARVCE